MQRFSSAYSSASKGAGSGSLPLPGRVGILSFGRWSRTLAEDVREGDPFQEAAQRRHAIPADPSRLDGFDSLLIGIRRVAPDDLDRINHLTTRLPSAVVALRDQ